MASRLFPGLHICILAVTMILGSAAPSRGFETPDILVLGDSQITFGSGPAYLSFFRSLARKCSDQADRRQRLMLRRMKSTAVIGVRSTSLREWSARSAKGKTGICDIDPVLKKNAGAYGTVNRAREKYVQIGVGADFQFCKPGVSPLEAAISPGYYQPKLLVMSFLGNAAGDWAGKPTSALQDVRQLMAQVPDGLPCVVMTTAPSFQMAANRLRLRAQANLQAAFQKAGGHCQFVAGMRQDTIDVMMSDKRNFRLVEGKVKDPFHPTDRGTKRYLKTVQPQVCRAVLSVLKR